MTKSRRIAMFIVCVAAGVILTWVLVRVGKIDLRLTLRQLGNVSPAAFARLLLLNFLMVALSAEKWRCVDATLREPSDSVPSRISTFAFTSIGMALGLLLPVQFGMMSARTLGTYFYGKPFRRGAGGTLFEQSFDLAIVFFLAGASGVTWFYHGGAVMWFGCASVMVVAAALASGPCTRLLRLLASYTANQLPSGSPVGAELRSLAYFERTRVLDSRLSRKLVLLSALRFFIVALMAEQTSAAIGAGIPLWQMAAMVPFVVVATLFAVTPGGIGVNELMSVSALKQLGTPLAVAGQWAAANRVLATAACFVVAAAAVSILLVERIIRRSQRPIAAKRAGSTI